MVTSEVFDLMSLLIHDTREVGKLLVDDFLVAEIDQRAQVEYGCTDEAEAPERDDLDEKVG